MKLYYFMKCSIFVITVKDVSFTMATKYSTDFRTFHLAVLHLHTVEVGFRMNRYAVRGVMGERQ
jgi:hypothetical protein